MNDPFAIVSGGGTKPAPYPMNLLFDVAYGIRKSATVAPRATQQQLDATRKASNAALAKARAQRAVTEAWYAAREAARRAA